MLGLCWTPAAVQGMQKVTSTMPSNPEQLLGAILVRKDIFNRFEATMHDTCLDANNLLEYLFSLYNSTATPAERENLPSLQGLGFVHRDTNCNKKVIGRGHHVFPGQPIIGNSQLPQPNIQVRPADPRGHQTGIIEVHKKKIKIDQPSFPGSVNLAVRHQDYSLPVSLKPYNNHLVFSGASNNQSPGVKGETTSEIESRHAQLSSSLPPFSQICRQGSRPYSPATAQYSDALSTPQLKDGHTNLTLEIRGDRSISDVKKEIEGALPGVSSDQPVLKNIQNPSKLAKKPKLKGSVGLPVGANNSNNGERTGRKKRTHQCFCGALFTRADNLKRHIRKCHEEKLEKLSGTALEFEVDNSGAPLAKSFSHAFPSSGQEGVDTQQPQNSQGSQQHQPQHYHQREDLHHPQDNNVGKSTSGVKWSCFCGESFDDHFRLVEHTRTHESNI